MDVYTAHTASLTRSLLDLLDANPGLTLRSLEVGPPRPFEPRRLLLRCEEGVASVQAWAVVLGAGADTSVQVRKDGPQRVVTFRVPLPRRADIAPGGADIVEVQAWVLSAEAVDHATTYGWPTHGTSSLGALVAAADLFVSCN